MYFKSCWNRSIFQLTIFRSWFKCTTWNTNCERNQFILYYKRGVNPRGWIYTPIHFRNVQHRKRYFYLRSGIFIQLWTTTRLRTIVLPFYFRKYVCRGMIAAMSWLFMPCSKLFAIQAVNSKKKKKTNDKSSASKQLPCEGRGSEIGLSFILVRYNLISNFQGLHFA